MMTFYEWIMSCPGGIANEIESLFSSTPFAPKSQLELNELIFLIKGTNVSLEHDLNKAYDLYFQVNI